MSTLYIFGDSFSHNYNETLRGQYAKDYFNAEKDNGYSGPFLDLQYNLTKVIDEDNLSVINTALGGTCNAYIFENFCRVCSDFKEGDYVSFQTTAIERFRVANIIDETLAVDVVPNHIFTQVDTISNFNVDELDKILVERDNYLYEREILHWIKMVRRVCALSKVKYFIWTIDPRLNYLSTIEDPIDVKLNVKAKYPFLNDHHPTFDGYAHIAKRIVNLWEYGDNMISYEIDYPERKPEKKAKAKIQQNDKIDYRMFEQKINRSLI